MRWLLVGRGKDGVEGAQLEGFEMYARELKRELGLETVREDALTLEMAERVNAARAGFVDAVLFMPSWSEPADGLVAWLKAVRARPGCPKLGLLDYYAQTSSPHFAAAAHVDVYLKRQVLRDRSLYRSDALGGGYVFTDFLQRQLGWDLEGWRFGSRLAPEHAHKLVSVWSLGVLRRYRRLLGLTSLLPLPWSRRGFDVNARIGTGERVGEREWYERYRELVRVKFEALGTTLRVSSNGRVSRRRYLLELARTRLVVSPFGWGEVCFRDYEAVAAGCLLVKPSMAHVETRPDIFVEHDTYVPLRWDLEDLEEVVRRCLEQPERSRRIAENARRKLSDYFERGGFVGDVRRVAEAFDGVRRHEAALRPRRELAAAVR